MITQQLLPGMITRLNVEEYHVILKTSIFDMTHSKTVFIIYNPYIWSVG